MVDNKKVADIVKSLTDVMITQRFLGVLNTLYEQPTAGLSYLDLKSEMGYSTDSNLEISGVIFNSSLLKTDLMSKEEKERKVKLFFDIRKSKGEKIFNLTTDFRAVIDSSDKFKHLLNESSEMMPYKDAQGSIALDQSYFPITEIEFENELPNDRTYSDRARSDDDQKNHLTSFSTGICVDEKTFIEIKTRRGQKYFRDMLLQNYEGKCCITGCEVTEALEAAHIIPHGKEANYDLSNGLLLRADIHTLYDLNLFGIDGNGKVEISLSLGSSEYNAYHTKKITGNISLEKKQNLTKRYSEQFKSNNAAV